MILMLYYVVGFWLTFSLVVLYSMKAQTKASDVETGEEVSTVFAALVLAMMWPVGLPTFVVMKVVNCFRNDDSSSKNDRSSGQEAKGIASVKV